MICHIAPFNVIGHICSIQCVNLLIHDYWSFYLIILLHIKCWCVVNDIIFRYVKYLIVDNSTIVMDIKFQCVVLIFLVFIVDWAINNFIATIFIKYQRLRQIAFLRCQGSSIIIVAHLIIIKIFIQILFIKQILNITIIWFIIGFIITIR